MTGLAIPLHVCMGFQLEFTASFVFIKAHLRPLFWSMLTYQYSFVVVRALLPSNFTLIVEQNK